MKHAKKTTLAATTLIVTAALGLAGCGDDSDGGSMPGMDHSTPKANPSSSSAPAGQVNDADVAFATQMIPHHQQAVQMAEMAIRKADTAEVKELATAIKGAQGPEIKQMSGWLSRWGKPVPSPDHGGHDMADPMPGMMTEDEMSDLGNATGAQFDRMWTQMMIKHHQGAVSMAKTEQTKGQDAAAVALAKKIETDQNREIADLQKLLKQPTGS